MKIYGVIYRAYCKITGKSYIGMTDDFKRRKSTHLFYFDKQEEKHPKFYRALRKYGPENFEWSILDCSGTLETLKLCEMFYISQYNTFHNGYNCTPGGDGFGGGKDHPMFDKHHSLETRIKIRRSLEGRVLTKATKRKMAIGQIGKIKSKETRKLMAIGKLGKNNPMFGCRYINKIRHKRVNGKWVLVDARGKL